MSVQSTVVTDNAAAVQLAGIAVGDRILTVPAEHLAETLAYCFPFVVGSATHSGVVDLWLQPVPVWVQGETVSEARTLLAQALQDYAAEWCDDLQYAPNHAVYWGYVTRVLLIGDIDSLTEILEAGLSS